MAVPAVLILAVVLWILFSAVKYWYISRTQIKYTHKLDDKLLEEMRRPSQRAMDMAAKRKREQVFIDEPDGYPYKANTEANATENGQSTTDNEDNKPETESATRPLTIFDEIDLMQKRGKVKPKSRKYDKSMFEDSLSRLYRDLQNEKKRAAEENKNCSDK
ncbi:unnamed protein product [Orchesella dallaii]|uniref:Uncharacterized protein n=1 Tax=Orchesella dallaii TaxID=48710 RepID=A0ABP1QG04_9HEXA